MYGLVFTYEGKRDRLIENAFPWDMELLYAPPEISAAARDFLKKAGWLHREMNPAAIFFAATYGGETELFTPDEISYICTDGKFIEIHGNRSFRFHGTLEKVYEALRPFNYLPASKSHIVSADHIKSFNSGDHILKMDDGSDLCVSRSKVTAVKEAIRNRCIMLNDIV